MGELIEATQEDLKAKVPTTVRDVLDWADTPEKVCAALDVERTREGGQRKSLVAALEERLNGWGSDESSNPAANDDLTNTENTRSTMTLNDTGSPARGSVVGRSNPPADFAAAANAEEPINIQRDPGFNVDPNAEVQSNTGAPGVVGDDGHDDAKLCQEHFPRGWDSPAARMHNNPEHLYPRVFCEHAPEGGYIRPVGR